ncbi:MAG: cytochrome C assembly protein [Chloroflexi bacterium RBG_16_64_32]|nr:MAG: cytochrome C assembly protein [Chloroflexi bacterium RBG_16_64_32]
MAFELPAVTPARAKTGLAILALTLLLAALVAAFVVAPTEREMGDVQRIFYFHVASAWTAFLAFFVVFLASIAYLRTKTPRWDIVAASAAEIGIVFTTLTLISGSVWARSAWGTWWTWEPRLTTTLMLWLIYVSYLILREMVEEPDRRAAFAAVFGIIGFVDVPIVFMSIRWWRTLHPQVVGSEGFDMEATMLPALFLSVIAFTVVFLHILILRAGLERSRHEMMELRRRARWIQEGGG